MGPEGGVSPPDNCVWTHGDTLTEVQLVPGGDDDPGPHLQGGSDRLEEVAPRNRVEDVLAQDGGVRPDAKPPPTPKDIQESDLRMGANVQFVDTQEEVEAAYP